MKKLCYLGFCLALGTGCCVVSDYVLITDNNQIPFGGPAGETRDTLGDAKIRRFQVATLSGGVWNEILHFVNQKADGFQTLKTFNNISAVGGGEATFADDFYCSPEHKGCVLFKAFDDDPTIRFPMDGSGDPFDGKLDAECPGSEALSLLLSSNRYYGECGRTDMLGLDEKLSLWNMGRLGQFGNLEALFYDLDRGNFSISLDNNAGVLTSLPVTGDAIGWFSLGGHNVGALDMSNPLLKNMLYNYANWLSNYGTHYTTVTLSFNGISQSFNIAGNQERFGDTIGPVSTPGHVIAFANSMN